MNYIPIILFAVFSTFFVSIINVYIIKNNIVENWDIIKITFFFLPLQFVISVLFSFYYIKGINYFTYPTLVIASYGFSICVSFVVNYYFLKKNNFDLFEIIGLIFIIIGIFLIFYTKMK